MKKCTQLFCFTFKIVVKKITIFKSLLLLFQGEASNKPSQSAAKEASDEEFEGLC